LNNPIDIALPAGPVWIAADLHLGPDTPATIEAFLAFLEAAPEDAASLLLPGDIFDAWIGDDVIHIAPEWLAGVLSGLQHAAARLPIWIGRGNRDFLISEKLAAATGTHLLPDSARLQTQAGPVLLSHGDEYCLDDIAYQQFRTMVRNPQWQAQFLAKSIPERLAMAQEARAGSIQANSQKSMEIMDVNQDAIEAAFRSTGLSIMVHGHTHRPARHAIEVDGRHCERWVLPDWDCDHADPIRGGWLAIEEDGLVFYDLEQPEKP